MVKLPLYAPGVAATFAILLMADAAEEDALLKQAQEFFQPLPTDMATAEFPITKERVELGCKRHIEMTPLCKVEATLLRVLGSREVRRGGGVIDEQAGVLPS